MVARQHNIRRPQRTVKKVMKVGGSQPQSIEGRRITGSKKGQGQGKGRSMTGEDRSKKKIIIII
jgi:hypothetical protein